MKFYRNKLPNVVESNVARAKKQTQIDDNDDESVQHAFADTTCRFALDLLLRRHGWRIWRREGNRQPVWMDNKGKQRNQLSIVDALPPGEVDDALLLMDFYYSEMTRGNQ